MNLFYYKTFVNLYKELLNQASSAFVYKKKLLDLRYKCLPNDPLIEIEFLELFDSYFNTVKYEIKITSFVLKNALKISNYAADKVYDALSYYDEKNYNYMRDIITRFKVACAKEDISYFYVSKRDFDYITKENYMNFINLAKGFDFQNVRDFICSNDIYNLDEMRNVLHNTTFLDYEDDSVGIYDDGLVLPVVNDDKSALKAIELLVRKSLLDSQSDINDDKVVNSMAIPIYYQMLYKKQNRFVKCRIDKNRLAYILQYNTKKEDNFNKVIKRVKRIKNSW